MNHPRSCLLAALMLLFAAPALAQSVGSRADAAHSCSTSAVASWELRSQLAAAESCWYPSALVRITTQPGMTISSGILRYASPQTRDAIYAASRRRSFNVNSAFRTLLEQYYLYTARASACMSVATPGSSNHESGTAVDVSPDGTNTAVRAALEGAGCRWFGSGDRVHFDCLPRGATRRTVITFQRLWNLNHPEDRIAEDNAYGPQTLGRLRRSPIHGFARTPCSEPPPPPPPPPSCDHTAGGLTFSCDGTESGQHCVSLDEPEDPDGWSNNYLCSASDFGFVFSTDGPVEGMRCTNVHESADAHADAWADDYACVPADAPIEMAWSSAGPMEGWDCVRWNETSDPGTWTDNYLCTRAVHCFSAGGFTFCNAGAPDGPTCVATDEPDADDVWNDNYFCSDDDVGMVWSHVGPIAGMTCTAIEEPDDAAPDAWTDNYLCLPSDAEVEFVWSDVGTVDGMDCARWYERTEGWDDNYLCVTAREIDAGAPDGGTSRRDASVADAGRSSAIGAGCACTASARTPASRGWLLLSVLALALLRRSHRRSLRVAAVG